MLRAILWDNDGVLVDTEGLFFRANRETLAKEGISLTLEQFIEISLTLGEPVLKLAAKPGSGEFDRLVQERNAVYRDLLAREPIALDGVREVLETLRGKYVMGIVTSCRLEHFEIIHRRSGLLPYFQFVLTLEDYERSKPDPEPYLKAVGRSGYSKEECLVIEDSPRGLASALGAGVRCIVIPSEFTRGGDFAGAYRVLNGIRELPALIPGSPIISLPLQK